MRGSESSLLFLNSTWQIDIYSLIYKYKERQGDKTNDEITRNRKRY